MDGAFICPPEQSSDVPASDWSPLAIWRWAVKQTKVLFLPFDIKYFSLRPTALKRLDYAFTQLGTNAMKTGAELYILGFEGIDDYTAIVPGDSMSHHTDFARGTEPLIGRVPGWCHPFMVHDDNLGDAIGNLSDAAMGLAPCYVNPTLGIPLTGYKPRLTYEPALTLGERTSYNKRDMISFSAIMWLWGQIEELSPDVTPHFNPVAPFICDFLMEFPALDSAVCVEHKVVEGLTWEAASIALERGVRSPFAKHRLHHFVIFQAHAGTHRFVCIPRHFIDDSWADLTSITPEKYKPHLFDGDDALRRMLEYMQLTAPQAFKATEDITRNHNFGEDAVEMLTSSGRIDDIQDLAMEDEGPSKSHHVPGLHWVTDILNKQCRDGGELICFPLDPGHPVGDHIVVEHQWSEDEKAAYDQDAGRLPDHVFSQRLQRRRSVPMRFIDMSGSTETYPFSMRAAYWSRPALPQHYMILGSTLKADLISTSRTHSSYLLFPSSFTTQFDHGCRTPVSNEGYTGNVFFRKVVQADDVLPEPVFEQTRTELKPFQQGSAFIKGEKINPLRYMVDLRKGGVYKHLRELMNGEGEMSINSSQSGRANATFPKALYHMKLADVHKAAWDFGRE